MGWVSGIVVYLLVWWVTLFTVLPWGKNPRENPQIRRKFAITTVVAAVIWVIIDYLMYIKIVDFRELANSEWLGLKL